MTTLAPLVVVGGTGTGIGKTTIACALVRAWSQRGQQVAGVKPVETGGDWADARALGHVSTFHVTRFTPPYLLTDAVSPHLAARREGVQLSLSKIVAWTNAIRERASGVVLELAGGLFTPLTNDATNADLVRRLAPSRVLLVAPDRLGVLHDVLAATRAIEAIGLSLDGIVLSAPASADASTSTNAGELRRILRQPPVLAVVPRGPQQQHIAPATRVLSALAI